MAPLSDSEGSVSSGKDFNERNAGRRSGDSDVLQYEQEDQELILQQGQSTRNRNKGNGLFARGAQQARHEPVSTSRRRRWRDRGGAYEDVANEDDEDDDKELMYDMEAGDSQGNNRSSKRSRDTALFEDEKVLSKRPVLRSRRPRPLVTVLLTILIPIAFLTIAVLSFRASRSTSLGQASHSRPPTNTSVARTLTNGTHLFNPTVLLISLDGFRASFIRNHSLASLTPNFQSFLHGGISAPYMKPSFPSLTFPNHFTLVTGLYPESHGIVANSFYDPELQEQFYYTHRAHSMQPKWWTAEPLWITAERHGIVSGVHMWPGSEALLGQNSVDKLEATYIDKFNGSELLPKKVNRVLSWLDLPGPDDANYDPDFPRPQFIPFYVPNVDAEGHRTGPDSAEEGEQIKAVDDMLGLLVSSLEQRNLSQIVNIVIVSDHGMAATDMSRVLQLETLLGEQGNEWVDKRYLDGWPHYGLRFLPSAPSDAAQTLYKHLVSQVNEKSGFDVYLRDENMPSRYHFSDNDRIAPLWLVPRAGWAITTLDEYDVEAALKSGEEFHPKGIHGYDHEHKDMRAVFAARGPAFLGLDRAGGGARVVPFQNTEIHGLVCDMLGIPPVGGKEGVVGPGRMSDNGTGLLGLPLKPMAFLLDSKPFDDEDEEDGKVGIPSIPDPSSGSPSGLPDAVGWIEGVGPLVPSGSLLEALPLPTAADPPSSSDEPPKDGDSDSHDGDSGEEEEGGKNPKFSKVQQWYQWMKDKYKSLEEWASDLIAQSQKDPPGQEKGDGDNRVGKELDNGDDDGGGKNGRGGIGR